MTNSRSDLKLQRWIDILAELLTSRYGLTLEQLRARVPGYVSGGTTEAVARMFERDKDELRALGVPLETIAPRDFEGEPQRYRVDPREMYLPFLTLTKAGYTVDASRGNARDTTLRLRSGYRSIPSLAFEPDELMALVRGAQCALTLEDPALVADATAALHKLVYDFPVGIALGEPDKHVVLSSEKDTGARLRALGQALLRLKRVTFLYRSMTRDVTLPRKVDTYGIFFVSGHWYIAGRDAESGELRNFRISRIQDLVVNSKRSQSHDYEIPVAFKLAKHATDQAAWALGDGASEEMVVEFRGTGSAVKSALRLGGQSALGDRFRVFRVRRLDVFARWVLSFAGDVIPVSPLGLVTECRAIAGETLALYPDQL